MFRFIGTFVYRMRFAVIAVLVAILGVTGPLTLDFYARTFGG